VVPLNVLVEFDLNPKGSNKCSLRISFETIAALFCVNVHFPVSGPNSEGYLNLYVKPCGELLSKEFQFVSEKLLTNMIQTVLVM